MLPVKTAAPRSEIFRRLALFSLLGLWASLTFSPALMEILFVSALAAWVLAKAIERERPQFGLRKPMAWALALFVAVSACSVFWSDAPRESVRGIFKILKEAALFLLIADRFRGRELGKFEKVFTAVFALVALDGFWQFFAGRDFLRGFAAQDAFAGVRLSACFKSYGIFGSFLISTLPFLFALGVRELRENHRPLRAAALFVLTAAGAVLLFWTRSRGCLVAFFLGLVLFLIFRRRFRLLAAACALALALLFILPRPMVIHLDADRKEQSLVERYYLWDRAVSVIRARPLTGIGVNAYAAAHAKYDTTRSWRVRNYYAHNGYLQMAAEIGLPGLAAFLAFLFFFFRRLASGRPGCEELGLGLGVLNFLLLALVDTVLHNTVPVMVFWFLLGTAFAYGRRSSA